MMFSQAVLTIGNRSIIRRAVTNFGPSRNVVSRFVPGESIQEIMPVLQGRIDQDIDVTADFLGEYASDPEVVETAVRHYEQLFVEVRERGLGERCEGSVKLSSLGLGMASMGDDFALSNARRVCEAAEAAGSMITVDMEDHTTTDATLNMVEKLRVDYPKTGVAIQAYLHRSETDCHQLARAGARVRLCKGAYLEPESVAYQSTSEVDAAYRRCLDILIAGKGYPMVASHDDKMIQSALASARRHGRGVNDYEFQMLYGIRTGEQERLSDDGYRVRVYVPHGTDWYGYFLRRLAERPANLAFFGRALLSSK